jgi:hypothetical protein
MGNTSEITSKAKIIKAVFTNSVYSELMKRELMKQTS